MKQRYNAHLSLSQISQSPPYSVDAFWNKLEELRQQYYNVVVIVLAQITRKLEEYKT